MAKYNYLLTRWQWLTDEHGPAWNPPAGVAGCIDLRPLPAQDVFGGTPEGWLFGCWEGITPSGILLATDTDMREYRVTTRERDAWATAFGYRPQGDTLADCLFDFLTVGADPEGDAGPRPLRPNSRGEMILAMGGHSHVRRERFRWGHHPHTNRVQACLHRDYRKMMAWVEAGLMSERTLRMVLGGWVRKYRLTQAADEWREFIPPEFRRDARGPLPPRSRVSDDFNRANESLDAGNWTEVVGDWSVVSNHAECDSTDQSAARYETDLDSDDHYAQVEVLGIGSFHVGVNFRFNSSNQERYCAHMLGTNTLRAAKFSSTGTRTNLDSDQTLSPIGVGTVRGWIDSTTFVSLHDGKVYHNFTDSTHSGNLRAGLHMHRADSSYQADDFEAADLVTLTFDADGTTSGLGDGDWTDSDTDSTYFDDCNDDPLGGSTDYIESDASHGAGATTSEIWLSLDNVPADFDSMDQVEILVDVLINGTVSDDTLTVTAQILDSDSGGTENALTDAQTIGTEADTTRIQRLLRFGSLTGTKAQWNSAHCRILASYSRTGSDDGFALQVLGAAFYYVYTAAAAEPGQDQPVFVSAGLFRPRRVVPRSLGV